MGDERTESQEPKPTLQLLGAPITANKLAEMFQRLTGREPTADGMEGFRKLEADLAAEYGHGEQVNDA